jgi:translocation and assembly module TamB
LLWLSASQSGLRALPGLVAELAPDSFRIGQVEGRLLGRIAITDLSIRRPAFGVRIGRLDLDWSPLQALGGICRFTPFWSGISLLSSARRRRGG